MGDTHLSSLLEGQDVACPSCDYNLRGNATGSCPECGTTLGLAVVPVGGTGPRVIRGRLAWIRFGLIVLDWAGSLAFSAQFLHDEGRLPRALATTGGLAAVLGLAAIASVFAFRRIHFALGIVFFGFVAMACCVPIVTGTLHTIWMPIEEWAIFSGFFAISIAGIAVEVACDRRSRAISVLAEPHG